MVPAYTIGVEQEFQLVDPVTGNLLPHIDELLKMGRSVPGEPIKAEAKQACVELVSAVSADIPALSTQLVELYTTLKQLANQAGVALINAGTHPRARWDQQKTTPGAHYHKLEEEFQDLERMLVIYGLHIHIGVERHELMLPLFNHLRSWLPHLLALSANSPFWGGRNTGLKSFRASLWNMVPRSGVPERFVSWGHYRRSLQDLVQLGCIDDGKDLCWDLRLHPYYPTLEFRICDMPGTLDMVVALAALCQALVAQSVWLYEHDRPLQALPCHAIEENRWRAMRYGLDGEFLDFTTLRRWPMREEIAHLLDELRPISMDLGSSRSLDYLRTVIAQPCSTGADRQLAVYNQRGNLQDVITFLIQQTDEVYSDQPCYVF